MQFTIKVPRGELQRMLRHVTAWDAGAGLEVERIIRSGTRRVAAEARRRVPVDTGKLKGSIRFGFSRNKAEGKVYTEVPYAHLVEFGTRGVTVKPKKKKAMKIPLPGETAFALRAKTPGMKERPFMKSAYDCEAPRIVTELKKALGAK